jgi:3-oxoacyl-[acyl-carrier protein] reductase
MAKTVLVSGGSRGIGLAIAKKLAADGFRVLAVARRESDDLKSAIATEPAIHFIPYDLAEISGIGELVRGLKARHGPLYGLVNNAALGGEGVLANLADAEIEKLVRLNILSPLMLAKYAAKAMMVAGEGRVVNISSIAATHGASGLSAYGASKASLEGFTRGLARELGRVGVTVNAVAPGFLETDMTASLTAEQREKIARRSALGRMAEVSDVAEAVSYLMSERARNVTGTVLTVDAGATA